MARRTNTRSNPDAESFQEIFDPESLIRRANKLQRLVITLSLPTKGVVSVNDICEHCDEEFGLPFPRTKCESILSEVVYDTYAFDFSYIPWSPWTSEPIGRYLQHFPDPEFSLFSIEITAIISTSKFQQPTSYSFTTPHSSAVPHITPIVSITPPSVSLGNSCLPPRMANRFSPILLHGCAS